MRIGLKKATYKTAAVILAAGEGSRMNMRSTKQRIKIYKKSILRRTLEAFERATCVSSITIVCKADEFEFAHAECEGLLKPTNITVGGKCRAESAKNGFYAIPKDSEFVMIHDGARCLISPADIDKVAADAYIYSAATASYAVSDTLKECDPSRMVKRTVSRDTLRSVQTPQAFSVDIYRRALENISAVNDSLTDDNMLVELLGEKIYCTDTSKTNIKITTSSDIELAEFLIMKENGI